MQLDIIELTKSFSRNGKGGNITALENITFSIPSGSFVSIVGPSGCGKTTLLEIIAGLQDCSSGRILIEHQHQNESDAFAAIVFQQYALFPWLTVEKNIAFGLKVQGVSKKDRRHIAQKYIDLVGLNGFEQFYPHELSGGMQQRVAIGRALATEPDVLLLDEPFAALDAQTKETCQKELLAIWAKTGVTVLFVTHDVAEAIFLSDRVMVMSRSPGEIKEDIDVLLDRPRDFKIRVTERFRELEHYVRLRIMDEPPADILCPEIQPKGENHWLKSAASSSN